jgi:hypothetical protein
MGILVKMGSDADKADKEEPGRLFASEDAHSASE